VEKQHPRAKTTRSRLRQRGPGGCLRDAVGRKAERGLEFSQPAKGILAKVSIHGESRAKPAGGEKPEIQAALEFVVGGVCSSTISGVESKASSRAAGSNVSGSNGIDSFIGRAFVWFRLAGSSAGFVGYSSGGTLPPLAESRERRSSIEWNRTSLAVSSSYAELVIQRQIRCFADPAGFCRHSRHAVASSLFPCSACRGCNSLRHAPS
jgi:hypothetical protein